MFVDIFRLLRQTSNSGKLTACVMTSEKDKDAEYIMVMKEDGYMTTIDLKGEDKHGKVCPLACQLILYRSFS